MPQEKPDGLVMRLARAGNVPPIETMESLIACGEEAIVPLLGLLDEIEPDEDDWTPLWVAMTLGEIGSSLAVPSLLSLLSLPESDVLAEASVEALAKIGPAALPALTRFASTAREWEARHYAYSAIGHVPCEESVRYLVGALDEDPMLWSSIAMALADSGRKEALPALRDLVRRASDREIDQVREAIEILEGRLPPYPKTFTRDWRERCLEITGKV